MDDPIDLVLARKILGTATPEDETALREWIRADPRRADTVEAVMRGSRPGEHGGAGDDLAWARVRSRVRTAESAPAAAPAIARRSDWLRRGRSALLRAAAVLVVGTATVFAARSLPFGENPVADAPALREARAARGTRSAVDLPDGTRIVLAPESRLRYPAAFTGALREVELHGQAYFQVSPDPERPFRIRAAEARVTVLGTRFVLRAYSGEAAVEVAVREGSVALQQGDAEAERVRLDAGDLGRLASDGRPTMSRGGATAHHFGWLDGRLVFRDATLAAVLTELSRYYDIEFRTPDSVLGRRVSFTIDNKPPAAVLDLLSVLLDVEVRREGGVVRLEPRTRAR